MKVPHYHRIYQYLRRQIDSEELKPGDLLPTESHLEHFFNVSRAPVRQALALLESEGMIIRKAGKGTFVAPFDEEKKMWLNFSPFRKYFRKDPGYTECRTILFSEALPTEFVKDFFMLRKNQKVLYIERLRSAKSKPVIFNQLYVNPMFDLKKTIAFENFFSLRGILMEQYGVEVTRIEDILTSTAASPRTAELLKVPEGHPLLATTRRTFSGDLPVLLDIFYTVTEIWDYCVVFEKDLSGKVTAKPGS